METNCGSYYGSMDRCQWIFLSMLDDETAHLIFSLRALRIFELFSTLARKKVKEFSLFRHFRFVFAFIHCISPTRSIDRIPRESIVEIIGVTREPDDGPVLSGTFALCVALSCNTSAQPDFTGGEFRQRRDASLVSEVTWVSTFRRSSICITLRKERNERGSRP